MRHSVYRALSLVVLVIVSVTWAQTSTQCQRWNQVADNSTQSHSGLRMQCQPNSTCTGITCSGIYYYAISPFPRKQVDFCFGFRLNPCSLPVSADIYLQVPEKMVSYVTRVTRSANLQVPKLTYSLPGNLVKADVFLEIHMGSVHTDHIDFGVDVTVRADYRLSQAWPEGLKRSLVPRQHLFVRHCTTSSPAKLLTVGQCTPMGGHATPKPVHPTSKPGDTTPSKGKPVPSTTVVPTKPSGHTTASKGKTVLPPNPVPKTTVLPTKPSGHTTPSKGKTVLPPKPVPKTTVVPTKLSGSGKPCNSKFIFACPPEEICKLGKCVCLPGNQDATGNCVKYTTTAASPPASTNASASKTPKTTVIASVVVASIVGLILVVIVVIVIVRWRRSRAQYSNHELLLNNDDNMVM